MCVARAHSPKYTNVHFTSCLQENDMLTTAGCRTHDEAAPKHPFSVFIFIGADRPLLLTIRYTNAVGVLKWMLGWEDCGTLKENDRTQKNSVVCQQVRIQHWQRICFFAGHIPYPFIPVPCHLCYLFKVKLHSKYMLCYSKLWSCYIYGLLWGRGYLDRGLLVSSLGE